jgi:hypothetical protein
MERQQAIARIVELVFSISDELEKLHDVNPNDLWPLHPDREPRSPFLAARPHIDEIVAIVRSLNGEQLSDVHILVKLLYNAAAVRLQVKINDAELRDIATRNAADLIDYRGSREVDVPLISLDIGEAPFTLGPVTLHPIASADRETDWWKWASSTLDDMADNLLLSYVRATVPGDSHRAIDNAAAVANEAILLLRGIGSPFTTKERNQFGILNEYPLWRNVPYRLGDPTETTRVDAASRLITTTGPFRSPYDLHKDILSAASPERIQAFLALLTLHGFSPASEFPARLVSGFRWLGQATKPDALAARFAKTAFALESFIGGEATDENLSTRGITATLAERAAFLVSSDSKARLQVDRDIRRHYAKRSGIAHGRASMVTPEDFEEFGLLVRELGWCLLERQSSFTSIDDLQEWVIQQRYSGPATA